MNIYRVLQNKGGWSNHNEQVVVADNEHEAKLSVFYGNREKRESDLRFWIMCGYNIFAKIIGEDDYVQYLLVNPVAFKDYDVKIIITPKTVE